MKTPWFMHLHKGVNTLVGVYPVEGGCYVRSNKDGVTQVTFYPQEPAMREPVAIGTIKDSDDAESTIDNLIEADMKMRGIRESSRAAKSSTHLHP